MAVLRRHRNAQLEERLAWVWATAALEAGVHPKVVSDRLGHSKVPVTLDVYSRVAPAGVEEEAARLVASKLLGAPVAGPQ